MATFEELTQLATRAMAGANVGSAVSTWKRATVQDWLRDAIRDYAIHFPRTVTLSIPCMAGVHQYDLPAGFRGAIGVEYPAGEDPPQYLQQRAQEHPHFWELSSYAVLRHHDGAQTDQLIIALSPSAGEEIALVYTADRPTDLQGTDTVTVPDRHHHLLVAHAVWQAWLYRLNRIASDLSAAGELQHQEAADARQGARQARMAYHSLLSEARKARSESRTIQWSMGVHDRIY